MSEQENNQNTKQLYYYNRANGQVEIVVAESREHEQPNCWYIRSKHEACYLGG